MPLTANLFEVDQCQPHENFLTACQSSGVVNWVKTKPRVAGNQIPFGGTDLVLYCVTVLKDIIDNYTQYKTKSVPPE